MKRTTLCLGICATIAAISFNTTAANAQLWKKIKKKVSDKIENKVDKALDGDFSKGTDNHTNSDNNGFKGVIGLSGPYIITPGTDSIYFDQFSHEKLGTMPRHWKTHGSGSIDKDDQFAGHWLYLNSFTSYKLKNDTALPENFTVEFDIITHSNEARDLEYFAFGFAKNNGVTGYIGGTSKSNATTYTQIHYWNQEIHNSSSDNDNHSSLDFPLAGYAIGKMHVAITVKGLHMQVYLDKHKVLDTDMFIRTPETKYFYISAPTRFDNGASIAVGNFKIAGL